MAKKRAKTLLKSRDDDAMVIDDESAPAAPLTGRQKHAKKVAAKRALRAAKQDIQQQRWAIPKRSVDRKAERKQLVEQAKAGAIDLSLAYATRTTWYDQKARRFAAHAHLQRMPAHDLRRADLLNASGRVHNPWPGGFSYYEAGYEKEDAHVGVRLPS